MEISIVLDKTPTIIAEDQAATATIHRILGSNTSTHRITDWKLREISKCLSHTHHGTVYYDPHHVRDCFASRIQPRQMSADTQKQIATIIDNDPILVALWNAAHHQRITLAIKSRGTSQAYCHADVYHPNIYPLFMSDTTFIRIMTTLGLPTHTNGTVGGCYPIEDFANAMEHHYHQPPEQHDKVVRQHERVLRYLVDTGRQLGLASFTAKPSGR